MKNNIEQAFEKLFPYYLDQLKELVKIPSISFDHFDVQEVLRSAESVKELFEKAGFSKAQFLMPPSGKPSVYAELMVSPSHPTILLYAHHDVQPEMRRELWLSDPFLPEERDGRLYGRGTADDKAGIIVHLAAVSLARELWGKNAPNFKFLIEGEEEAGSSGLEVLLAEHKDLLKADAVIVADLNNIEKGTPCITTSLRGMSAIEVTLSSTETPLHSGSWSGPIPDPAQALCRVITSLTNEQGDIVIEGFYDDIIPPTAEELDSYSKLPLGASIFKKDSHLLENVALLVKESEIPLALWRLPSIVITALESGNKKIAGNVLQNTAYARISIRLAPGMDAERSTQKLIDHIQKNIPYGLHATIEKESGAGPFTTNTNHPYFQKMKEAMTESFNKEAKFIGCGASIPGAVLFRETFGEIPILLIGLEDPESNPHSENESLDLADFKKTMIAETLFFGKLASENT